MAFLEQRIALTVNRRTRGGPVGARTKTYAVGGRLKQRFARTTVLNRYDFSYSLRTAADFEELRAMFYVVMGTPYSGFRARDWHDYQLTRDNSVLLASGSDWQIHRRYSVGAVSVDRKILKPEAGSVVVWRTRAGVASQIAATVDATTGLVTLAGHAEGDTYACTGRFDVPVTFVDDAIDQVEIDGSVEGGLLHGLPSILLEELSEDSL